MTSQVTVSYAVWLGDSVGNRLAYIDDLISVNVGLTLNDHGSATIVFPGMVEGREFDYNLVKPDGWLEIWRRVDNFQPKLLGDTAFMISRRRKEIIEDNTELITIVGYSAAVVCDWPIVAYNAGTSQAEKTNMWAGDLIKQVARENLGGSATDADRDISTYFSVQSDLNDGVQISKSFSRRKLSRIFTEVCNTSIEEGTRLYWDVIVDTPNATSRKLELRTYQGQRGSDQSSSSLNPLVFSPKRGNLRDPAFDEDWIDSANYAYAGGQGQGAARDIQTASSNDRINLNPWGRIKESWRDVRHVSASGIVLAEAESDLRDKRPKKTLTGQIINTPTYRFGVEWNHGDIVKIEAFGQSFDAIISPVAVSFRDNQETITANLVAEE